jgi:hypothetical protein
MLENSAELFENRNIMMRKLKKNGYETFMQEFREKHGGVIDKMIASVGEAEDKQQAASEVGSAFAGAVYDAFAKKGKVKGDVQADLNMFMIYYVFPAIQLTEDAQAITVCDGLKDAWNERFRERISYTTYDKLYDSFREKIFGIF